MIRRWLPRVLLTAAAALAAPAAASAAEIFLNWDECRHDGAGTTDMESVCFSEQGESQLISSFVLDAPLDDVIGIEMVVDLQHSGTLPDWWRLQGKGECRDGALLASGNFLANEVCTDPWNDLGGGIALYDRGLPFGQPGQARLTGAYAIRADSARALVPGVHYYGLKLLIRNEHSTFPGLCAGCGESACLVLNRITLLRSKASEPPTVTLEAAGPPAPHRVTWRGGSAASCATVPARRVTWGAIRALYR